jgi:hypothetical protein
MPKASSHKHTNSHGFKLDYQAAFAVKDERNKTLEVDDPAGNGKVSLKTRTYILPKAIANFGGLFEKVDLDLRDVSIFDLGSGKASAYYIESSDLTYAELDLLGVVIPQARLSLRGLTNHPALTQGSGWIGRVTISGDSIQLPSIQGLSITPRRGSDAAVVLDVYPQSRSVGVGLDGITYRDDLLQVSGSGNLSISAGLPGDLKLGFKGVCELALPGLGLLPLVGDLDFTVDQQKLQTIGVGIESTQSIAGLGFAGRLNFRHDVSLNQGRIELSKAKLFDLALSGSLAYDSSGIRGTLAVDGTSQPTLTVAGLSLKPLNGTILYNYAKTEQGAWAGDVSLAGAFDVAIGSGSARFNGDLSLSLDGNGMASFRSANLELASDLDLSLSGFSLRLAGQDGGTLAPTRLGLIKNNGTLTPSLSGTLILPSFSGLAIELPANGLTYGPTGWQLNGFNARLNQDLDLGMLKLGDAAQLSYRDGLLSLNPDLSVNLAAFNLAIKPLGNLIVTYFAPVVDPIISIFKTDIDLRNIASVNSALESLRDVLNLDLPTAWASVVAYLEAYPGNPYRDNQLTAGELLDFVVYTAFDKVQSNPQAASAVFRQVFGLDLPGWLKDLPQGVSYAPFSLASTVKRLEDIKIFGSELSAIQLAKSDWVKLPLELQLNASAAAPTLGGPEQSQEQLRRQLGEDLKSLSTGLRQLANFNDQQVQRSQAIGFRQQSPLSFDVDFNLPLLDDPVTAITSLIANRPFDLLSTNLALRSGIDLGYRVPLSTLVAAIPAAGQAAAGVLQALNASLNLRAGLMAEAALSLGLTTTANTLGTLIGSMADPDANAASLVKAFASKDADGNSMGLYVGQPSSRPLLSLLPSVQVGLGFDRLIAAEVFGKVEGDVGLSLDHRLDGRYYLTDALTGQLVPPGLNVSADVKAGVGLSSSLGDARKLWTIVDNATLFSSAPKPQAPMAFLDRNDLLFDGGVALADAPLLASLL